MSFCLFALGCRDPDPAIVPSGLRVTALPGGNGVLEVVALTLRRSTEHPEQLELYAALQNRGQVPACDAALSVELFDKNEQSLAAGISGLLTQSFFRLKDGSGSIAACIAPLERSMAAVTELATDAALEDVGSIVYRCPYFALDVERVDGLSIESLSDKERRYQGVLVNHFATPVVNPSVSIFPITSAGRPLGLITARDTITIAAGSSWSFTVDSALEPGADFAAYPAGAIQRQ